MAGKDEVCAAADGGDVRMNKYSDLRFEVSSPLVKQLHELGVLL